MINQVLEYVNENQGRYLHRLKDFLRIPSISTDPAHKADMRAAAEWACNQLTSCGIEAQIIETQGHPCVVGDSGPGDGAGPTILIYGHYDVQPTGDRALWEGDPFEPREVDGNIVARGAADNKGQVLAHLLAAEAWKKVAGTLPVRCKFLVEGEEEIGSQHLKPILEGHRGRLACDYVVISDTAKLDADTPAITYGTKGMAYMEIEVIGPKQDLHSGSFGGSVTNPGNALCRIIASLKDSDDRVTIPGFYDDVQEVSGRERQMINALPFSETQYLNMVGSPSLNGEAGFTTPERRGIRPTLDVNGLFGGFMGEGMATIVPKKVGAKVSMRLVPDQDPEKIARAFDEAVRSLTPDGVRVTTRLLAGCRAYVCPLDLPGLSAAKLAIKDGFGIEPVLMREGGSLPILPMFKQILGADSIMIGLCRPDANIHGPNEFFVKDDFFAGIRTSACFMRHLAQGAEAPIGERI